MGVLSQDTVSSTPGGRGSWTIATSFGENARYSCNLCPYSTEFGASLKRHLRKHAELEMAGVPDDATRCSSTTMLSQSPMSHPPGGTGTWRTTASDPGNARYLCDLCPYSTEFEASLKKHVRSHAGVSPRDTIFVAAANMTSGVEVPSNPTSHAPCPVAADDGKDDGSAHVVASTEATQKAAFDPPPGSAGWSTSVSNARYVLYTCRLCTYQTRAKGHLIAHLRTHTGETPYQCATCSRSFSQSSNLRRHEMVHRGDRPFQCDVCSRAFTQKSHLIMHVKQHHEEPSSKASALKQ